MSKKRGTILGVAGLLGMALWLSLGVTNPPAAAYLPPRPTVAPAGGPGLPPGDSRIAGGWIELRAPQAADPDLWTVVQWQDSTGAWLDVDGWRGTFDSTVDGTSQKKWWFDQWIFGQGPFRWVVYRKSTGQVLGQSNPFNLAALDRQTTTIELTLAR